LAAAQISLLSSINNYLAQSVVQTDVNTALLQEILTAVSSGAKIGVKNKGKSKDTTESATTPLEGVSSVISSLKDLPKLTADLFLFKLAPTGKLIKFIKDITDAITLGGTIKSTKYIGDLFSGFASAFTAISGGIGSLSKGLLLFSITSKTTGPDKFIDFLNKLMSGKDSLINKITPANAKKFHQVTESLSFLSSSIIKLALGLTAFIPLSITAMAGAWMFGKTVNILLSTVLGFGKKDKETSKNLQALSKLGGSVILFGLGLVGFMTVGIFAMAGAWMFGKTVNILLSTVLGFGKKDKETSKNLQALSKLGGSVILFGLGLVGFLVISPVAIIGALVFGLTVGLLLRVIDGAGKKSKTNLKDLNNLGKGILLFGLAMIVTVLIFPVVIVGALLFGVSMFLIKKGIRIAADKKTLKGAMSLALLSLSIIAFGYSLGLFNQLTPWESIIKAPLAILAVGLSMAFIGNWWVNILKASLALTAASVSLVAVSISLVIFNVVPWESIIKAPLAILAVGLSMAFAGMLWVNILKGAVAMTAAAIPLVIISFSLAMWQKANITWETIGQAGATLLMIGTELALAGLLIAPIGLGAIAIGLGALAIWGMTYALAEFKKLNWKNDDSNSLTYTISSVLGALSGTDKSKGVGANITGAIGQGLQAILALISIGPIILGSAAIWVMSMTLKEFKTVGWTKEDSTNLKFTISSVLEGLSGGKPVSLSSAAMAPLQLIVSLMSAGSIFVASGAIWVMSMALNEFKKVGWTKDDTTQLSFTIKEILGVMKQGEDGGGLWGAIKGVAKSALGTLESVGTATSIGLAGLSIMGLSSSLIKWKESKWENKDTKLLTTTIHSIMSTIKLYENKDFNKFRSINTLMTGFAKNIIDLGNKADPLEKVANSIEKISKGFSSMFKSIENISTSQLEKVSDIWKNLTEFGNTNFENFQKGIDEGLKAGEKLKDYKGKPNPNIQSDSGSSYTTTKTVPEKETKDTKYEMLKIQFEEMSKQYQETNSKLDRLISLLSGEGKLKVTMQAI